MIAEDERGPGLKFPPPLLVLAVICLACLIDWFVPLPIIGGETRWISGAALTAIALLLAVLALFHFFEAETHVEPWHPTTTIIQKGVYRHSRNPIYLAFCIATGGVGLLLNSWWIIGSILPLVYLLQRLVIRREESYLEKKFGQHYLDYKNKVRRWL